jgi:hypothetical protein
VLRVRDETRDIVDRDCQVHHERVVAGLALARDAVVIGFAETHEAFHLLGE